MTWDFAEVNPFAEVRRVDLRVSIDGRDRCCLSDVSAIAG